MTAALPVRPGAATALPPAGGTRSTMDRWADLAGRAAARTASWLVRGIVGLAVLAFLVLAVGPHLLGYRTLTMLTSSMSPEIDPGDVVVVTPIEVSEVTEGMVITYHQPVEDHSVVTHRVVSVRAGDDGSVQVRTKGDANTAIDPWTAALEGDTAYQLRVVIPELGHVIQALRAPVVAPVLLYGAPALLAGWLLLTIWRPTHDDKEARA
jgi:signal peptidase I